MDQQHGTYPPVSSPQSIAPDGAKGSYRKFDRALCDMLPRQYDGFGREPHKSPHTGTADNRFPEWPETVSVGLL